MKEMFINPNGDIKFSEVGTEFKQLQEEYKENIKTVENQIHDLQLFYEGCMKILEEDPEHSPFFRFADYSDTYQDFNEYYEATLNIMVAFRQYLKVGSIPVYLIPMVIDFLRAQMNFFQGTIDMGRYEEEIAPFKVEY